MKNLILPLLIALSARFGVLSAVCPVSLPQDTPGNTPCGAVRQRDLVQNQAVYNLVPGEPIHQFATLNMTQQALLDIIKKDPFMRDYGLGYLGMAQATETIFNNYVQQFGSKEITALEDYAEIKLFFKAAIQLAIGDKVRSPSDNEAFQSDFSQWLSDEFYAQQALAGINPMTLQRVSNHGDPGRRCHMKTRRGQWCNFPFKFRGQLYYSCNKRNPRRPWCSTSSKYNTKRFRGLCGEKVDEEEGPDCTVKTTDGEWCHFPFTYRGKTYTSCTTAYHDRLWCATTAQYRGLWGNCEDHEEEKVEDVGLDWKELSGTLNPEFDWQAAAQAALGDEETLEKAIRNGRLYALRYPICDDIQTQRPDITDRDPRRVMRDSKSAISLFVSHPEFVGGLKPVAIQIDHTPDSPVYTPKDGDDWTLAKLEAHITDIGYSQIVEHLVKVHFIMEAVCVVLKRQIPSQHPLNQILKFHCREITVPNTFGTPSLVNEEAFMHRLFAYGNNGVVKLIRDSYTSTSWDVTDFRRNIKMRGLDDRARIPYFPYRDDGEVIMTAIEDFVGDYLDLYYKEDEDVQDDTELQRFANEISVDGEGPTGGIGQLKGFPAKISSKDQLKETVSRIIWQLAAQHASINYELIDYTGYIPNIPTKIYNDTRVEPGEFSYLNLPNRLTAAIHERFISSLSTYRYDRLLDYGFQLTDLKAREVVYHHFSNLMLHVQELLERRNLDRKARGLLTYPYLLPRWLPNGVQS